MTLLILLLILVVMLAVVGIATTKPSEYDVIPPEVLTPPEREPFKPQPVLGGRNPHG
jgi:hypothetical protein